MFDMIARLKYNKAIRREKKGYFAIAKEYRNTLAKKRLTYKACSEEDIREIRETIREHHRQLFLKRITILVVSLFLLLMIIMALIVK